MAYAGICSDQNIQSNSDDYFHTINFDEIVTYTTTGNGGSCGTTLATGNNPPSVNAGAGGFSIPIDTPFILTGSATDPNADPLTYNWEQFNLGPAGHPNNPVGNAPIFRSFDSVTSPTRVFPQLSDIVNNTQTIGEILPSYTRDLTFRLTVRDNHVAPSAGGVAYDTIDFDVTDTAGPFLVADPIPLAGGFWPVGAYRMVNWDVANTNNAPVNCSNVDISLSTDGGYTAPISLATSTPNDGSEFVQVPNNVTTTARVWVKCTNNIFFDMSDTNFSIVNSGSFAQLHLEKAVSPAGSVNPGDTLTYDIDMINIGNANASATITDTFDVLLTNTECDGVPGDLSDSLTLLPGPANAATYECTADVDATLAVDISKSVDQTDINAGQAVTYTITVTNPNTVALENLTVADPDVAGCTPALGTPITLGAGASQTYVCPDNVLTEDTTNTATVSAEVTIANSATASAPETGGGPVTSNEVTTIVDITNSDSVSVNVEGSEIYLPAVFRAEATNAAPPVSALPVFGISAVLLGGVMMVLVGRRRP
jgi:uncharacterized repeat protein (TIGR01451 family)